MSVFSNIGKSLLQWGLKTAKNEAQQVAIQALSDATNQLQSVVQAHAPDVAEAMQPALQSIITTAIAGIKTRS